MIFVDLLPIKPPNKVGGVAVRKILKFKIPISRIDTTTVLLILKSLSTVSVFHIEFSLPEVNFDFSCSGESRTKREYLSFKFGQIRSRVGFLSGQNTFDLRFYIMDSCNRALIANRNLNRIHGIMSCVVNAASRES